MKILIAEDDRVSRRVLGLHLTKWGYEVVQASDGTQAWELLQREDAPQLVLLDWMMPGMDGTQICREIRKRSGQPYVYVLLLTAKGRKQDVLAGLEAGADDYVVKPFDAQELQARVRVGKRIVELHRQLQAAGEAMRFQANHDALTGLCNRTAILETLQRELARSEREGNPVGVVLADLDHFKQVNDHFGHLVGDEVLREAARRMILLVRIYDSIGRYGGEEFLFVVPGCDAAGTRSLAKRICASICSVPIRTLEGPVPLTTSLGVASTDILPGDGPDTLLHAADLALYRAKAAGRNRVELAAGAEGADDPDKIPAEIRHTPEPRG